ncbi:hypothetical protein AB0G32_03950 [Streptomyces sp. NPDC023723]|uniref:hypothetical protein n=1 Tax=Streptomyces sp. NPDC023723 TaxID=3154323 RepID=UPI0033C1F8C3
MTDDCKELKDRLGRLETYTGYKPGSEPTADQALSDRITAIENQSDFQQTATGGVLGKFESNLGVAAWDVFKLELPSLWKGEEVIERFLSSRGIERNNYGFLWPTGASPSNTQQPPPANETDTQRAARLQREGQEAQTRFQQTQQQIADLQRQSQSAMDQLQTSAQGLHRLEEAARAAAAAVGGGGPDS